LADIPRVHIMRILYAFVPFAVILAALAAAGLWWEFGVVALLFAAIGIGSAIVVFYGWAASSVSGKDTPSSRPRWATMTATERADFLDRRAWRFAAIGLVVDLALFLPEYRVEPWWVLPAGAVSSYVLLGLIIRGIARWLRRYEQDVERYTKGSRRGHRDQP
jgi:hypothetical protein